MSAQVTITQLPAAGPITGTESVPIVQNGVTVQTTTGAISASPSQTQTFLTVNQEPTLPNSRSIGATNGLVVSDGGAQGVLNVTTTGALSSLVTSGTGFQVKTSSTAITGRSIATSGAGLTVADGSGVSGNPTVALSGQVANFANASFNGLVALSTAGNVTSATVTGTASQINVANGTGVSGNPTISLASDPVIPGTGGVVVPAGTTAQRGTSTLGNLRYNSSTGLFEGYNGAWTAFTTGGSGVTSVGTGTGLTGGPITSTGTISLANTAVTAGSYTSADITVDAQGRITAAASGSVATGTVTSVDVSGGTTGLTTSGGPITAAGTITLAGTLGIANGGTGQTTASAAFNALSPVTTTGDLIIGNGTNSATRLGIGANGYLLTSNGTTATWAAAPAGGVTTFAGGTTGLTPASATSGAVTLAGTLAVANGGTGRTVGNYSIYANEIHVGKDGNDTTGDGTLINPVLTITKALTLIAAGRNTVIVHPGSYSESPTVTSANTTISTTELTGANTQIAGTLTLSAAARVSGIKLNNLTITGSGNTYISNCTVDTQLIKSGSNYVEIINTELQCVSGVQITGAGTVSIVGNKCWAVTVSNASANVLIKDSYQVLTASVTAGNLQIDGSAVFAASPASNAVTSSAGSFITLANSFILNSAGTGVERVSLAGFYSILNLVYDKTNSTFAGTNLNAIDYFSVINADSLVLTNDLPIAQGGTGQSTAAAAITALTGTQTSGQYLRSDGTNAALAAIQAADVPTLNQNTTGTAANVTGTVAVANGGTGLTTTPANGALDIGNGTGFTRTTLTAGANVTITNSAGGITIASTAGGSGTVTSVAASVPSFLSVTGSPITTAGTLAIGYSGTALPILNGGTGATTAQAAMNAFAGAVTSGSYLRGNGTNVVMNTIQAADVPTLNQNTTGTAGNVTGTVAIANGGSGATTAQTAMNAFAGAVTSGSYLRGNGTNVVMNTIQAGDVPTLNQNTTGTAANVTGTVAVANGGTGQTTYTNGQLLIGNTTGNTLTKTTLTAGCGITITNGTGSITIAASGGGGCPATPTVEGIVYGKTQNCAGGGRTALGINAGRFCQGAFAIAIGNGAACCNQGVSSIAIGVASRAKKCNDISIGVAASTYVFCAIAIGTNSVVGITSGPPCCTPFGTFGIGIGNAATVYGCNSIAIGRSATAFGFNSIAIGFSTSAGCSNQTHIGPVRNASTCFTLKYNPCTREVTYT